MDASVVVPAYDEAETIGRTLDSLAGQDAEVVVAAGGTDDTVRIAERHPAADLVTRAGGKGPGAARNRGAAAARGELLLFTDADTVVPGDWVERHRRHYDREGVVGVGGPARPLDGGVVDEVLFTVLSDWWYRVSWPLGFVQQPGFNASVRRSAFEAVSGFDEALPFQEDTDLSLRLKRHGEVVYDPSCVVRTSPRREHEEGYAGLLLRNVRGYVSNFVLGKRVGRDYFEKRR
jgi:glycosyltransferase involved in cell wall biosynthesis